MKAEKNCCSLVHGIENCIISVFESYAYNEVMHNYDKDTDKSISDIINYEIKDEITPLRIYSLLLNNDVICSVLCGKGDERALTEQAAMAINCMLGLGLEKVTVRLGDSEKWDKVKSLLKSYGYEKFISEEISNEDKFVALSEDNKILFEGLSKVVSSKECAYTKFYLNEILNILSYKAEPESKLLPVTLVASDDPSLSFSVALGLRSQGLKVEEYLENKSMIDAEEYASLKGITILLWVNGNSVMMKNLKSGERSETTVDKLLKNK